ncbi:helix-turn-helix domain-containing protein [Halobellus limi]|uniref:HTH DNA binding domain-containing protein n=1 Tax=Halobellus limi TaxID=699433 RepID=A0A1H6BRM3_9EURY|nr:helix-turn-helix domain-containing protein [Halobellus limi]QCC49355.1 helix-turn-helix domain-containing protein [Halobellus limi]SEG63348.1 HTH DNA binding domain-containing protein [Halobellus limi]
MREAKVSITDGDLSEMGIEKLFSLSQEAGLRNFEELACRGRGAVIQVELETRCDETALDELEYVNKWNHVAERDDSHVYVISFTAPDLPESLEETAGDLVGTCDPDVDERGATMSLVGPHKAVSGQLNEYEDAGISPTLQRIGGYDGPDYPLDDLTARQREVIQTAWEMGYYEVPKAVSAKEIATELELDSSTVNEHLQRAERNLLGQLL